MADLNESLGMLPQEETEKYLSLLKKAMSGTMGKNLIDISFTTQQVMDSEEHRLLMKLRTSALRDDQARKNFYKTVIESLDLEHSNYLILLAQDAYDVPHHGKNGEIQEDASETTFSYFVCAICPVKEGKVELNYFPGDNEFHCTAGRTVVQPELGFLFPAFDDRAANLYNALFYSRKADNLYPEFLNAVFHTEPPMSAPEQKVAFQNALVDSLGILVAWMWSKLYMNSSPLKSQNTKSGKSQNHLRSASVASVLSWQTVGSKKIRSLIFGRSVRSNSVKTLR